MNFKVDKIVYNKTWSPADAVYSDIRKEVHDSLIAKMSKSSDKLIWMKAAVLILSAILFFIVSLRSQHGWLIILSYILFGWALLLLGFNLGHDAAHNSLPANKKINQVIFESVFALLGANPYLWKIRHIYSHHPYPNVDGCDADIELTKLLRFSNEQPCLKIHRFQHVYAPFLYTIYTIYWIFYKDFILFFRKKQANIFFHSHPAAEWIKLFLYKVTYLFIFLGIPVLVHAQSTGIYILSFFLMHIVNSLFLLFTFLISHHVPQTHLNENAGDHSWFEQQVTSSADFHAESAFAYWIFGGFNAHTAHHLFPRICHVHYPLVTKIIRENLQKNQLPYNYFSFARGIRYHLQFLKQMGN